jgi:hypothetical protein
VNTGVPPAGIVTNPNHIPNLATSVSGIGPKDYGIRGGGRGAYNNGRGQRTVIVPYGVPVFYGDPSYYGQPQQQAQPNITVVVPPRETPTVIINQNYTPERANPVLRDYSDTELPPASNGYQSDVRVYQAPPAGGGAPMPDPDADKPTIFLIAMKDGSIHSAIGYWTEGKTFGYVTPNASVKRMSLDELDIATTEQLNKDRKVPFDLKRE